MEKSDGTEERETVRTAEKASVLEKLHRYQQEGRQQPKHSVKKNLWIEEDKV
jgi:hypothetical protein